MTLLRLLLVGLAFALIYRAVRRALRDALSTVLRAGEKVSGKPRKPEVNLDESQIQDAEFRDIDA